LLSYIIIFYAFPFILLHVTQPFHVISGKYKDLVTSIHLACEASVPVPRKGDFSQSGCTKNEARAKRWKEGLFALAPFFARPECENVFLGPNFVRVVQERLLRRLAFIHSINLKKAGVGQPKYCNNAHVHVVLTNLSFFRNLFCLPENILVASRYEPVSTN